MSDDPIVEAAAAWADRLATSDGPPYLRLISDVAVAYRLPISVVMAWPEEDQAHAIGARLAAQIHDSKVCPGCGTHEDEWVTGRTGSPRLVADLHSCPGCRHLNDVSKKIADKERGWLRARFYPADQPVAETVEDLDL